MKKFIYEDLGKKFSVSQIAKIEDEIAQIERKMATAREIVRIADIRKEAEEYWNSMSVQERIDLGKSNSGISLISFANVAEMKFEEMSDFWRAMYLSSVVEGLQNRKCNRKVVE